MYFFLFVIVCLLCANAFEFPRVWRRGLCVLRVRRSTSTPVLNLRETQSHHLEGSGSPAPHEALLQGHVSGRAEQ